MQKHTQIFQLLPERKSQVNPEDTVKLLKPYSSVLWVWKSQWIIKTERNALTEKPLEKRQDISTVCLRVLNIELVINIPR